MKQKLFENFAHPRGLVGRLAGLIMARKRANVERGRWAVAELSPKPDARVLEIGYGPGLTLAEMCRMVTDGRVIGVDLSEVMRSQAARRNSDSIRAGRLELRVGDAEQLDPDLTDLDLVYGVNVWQFWDDQPATVADLARRLAPHGRLALAYMQPPTGATTHSQAQEALSDQLRQAGLVDVEVSTMAFDPPAVMAVGHREPAPDVDGADRSRR